MSQNMMQQYQEAKERHPGMLLLFQNGSFYELFYDDAVVGSRVLGITLTRREKTIPMAGFRTQDLEAYLPQLLHAGHRVAVCDQVEDPALAQGLASEAAGPAADAGAVLAGPREALPHLSVTPRPDWTFDPDTARAALLNHFGVTTLAGFGFDDRQPCVAAAGALLLYLRE